MIYFYYTFLVTESQNFLTKIEGKGNEGKTRLQANVKGCKRKTADILADVGGKKVTIQQLK